jgi:histidine triad (HIT) family protein
METIFGKIIRREIPAEIVFENEKLIAIKDIHPQAPIHLLIIPKEVYPDLQSVPSDKLSILQDVAKAAQHLAKEFHITQGYRLLTNNGSEAGQTVFHLHFHLLGGRDLGALG